MRYNCYKNQLLWLKIAILQTNERYTTRLNNQRIRPILKEPASQVNLETCRQKNISKNPTNFKNGQIKTDHFRPLPPQKNQTLNPGPCVTRPPPRK